MRHGSVLVDQCWLQWVNKLLPALKAGNPEEKFYNFDYPAAAKMFKTATDTVGLSGMAMYQTRHRLGKKCSDEVSGKRSAVSRDTTEAVVWRPTTTLSLTRSETKLGTLAQRAEVLLTKQLQTQPLGNA